MPRRKRDFTEEEEKEKRAARKRLRSEWKTGVSEENKTKAVNLALKRAGGKKYSWMTEVDYPTGYAGPEIRAPREKSPLPIEYDRYGNVVEDDNAKGVIETEENPIKIGGLGSAAGTEADPITIDDDPEPASVPARKIKKPTPGSKGGEKQAAHEHKDDGGWEREELELRQLLSIAIDFMT
ncbi:hypothetical protein GGS26DRAFT_597779 [Hypomontagnella submonticulosa]|nr:hypothetical protein GGS26DRAFT_597779 [Hypomontagnella submonticulosa]